MMETARTTWSPWRAWTAIALVLVTLALVQACGESSKHTGPTSSASLQLKLRRAGGAELPAGCTGTYSVTGPGVNIQNAALSADGHISFQGQLGQDYTVTVNLNCPGVGPLTGSIVITVPPGGTKGEVVINVSKVLGVACNPSTVGPGESSTCKCDVQTVNAPSITWTGVNSTSATATFSNQNPGTYTVSCTINGVDTRSTTVTVKAPEPPPAPEPQTGNVKVNSTLTSDEGNLDVSFNPRSIASMNNIPPGGSRTRNNVPTGQYTATAFWCGECSCSVSFVLDLGETQVLNLPGDCD